MKIIEILIKKNHKNMDNIPNFKNGLLPETKDRDEFIKQLKQRIDYLQDLYNNSDKEIIDDEQFDALLKYYNDFTGEEYAPNGAKYSTDDPLLPCYAPSLGKIKDAKGDKQLSSFLSKYEGNLINMDKYDGISVIVRYTGNSIICQKRGDGYKGPDISFITNYGNQFPNLRYKMIIRGEYVLFDSDFEELKPHLIANGRKANNSRSAVNGATSRVNPDPVVLARCKFIPYSIYKIEEQPEYGLKDIHITQSYQLESLKQLGFYIPPYIVITKEQATIEFLMNYLDKRKNEASYRIDGTVLTFDIPTGMPEYGKNPDYSIAVKKDTIKFTTITGCEWKMTSKDGYLTPVIQVEPVVIITTVTNITLNNGRMVYLNKLSPGTVIATTQGGDIIPKFLWVVSEGNGRIFCPDIPYEWNKNGVEILVSNPDNYPQIICAKLKYFLSVLDVKKWGLLTIWKLYHSGLTNLGKLIRVTINQLMLAEGIQETLAQGLLDELQKGISNATMPKIMAGSCIFGEGLGDTIMKKFITKIPNWRYSNVTYEQILELDGFGPVRAKMIYEKLPEFIHWLNGVPELEGLTIKQVIVKNHSLTGFIFYFTGFTDEILRQEIESYGGIVEAKSMTKLVNFVVSKDANFNSKKTDDARASGGKIKLMTKIEFEQYLRQIRNNIVP
jgi:NAD-dependent DNA ligase